MTITDMILTLSCNAACNLSAYFLVCEVANTLTSVEIDSQHLEAQTFHTLHSCWTWLRTQAFECKSYYDADDAALKEERDEQRVISI